MHDLASMSQDDRDRLLDQFWDEITDGLTVHPVFAQQLHQMRPTLPAEPTTEQLQAWIELAGLVRDDAFRREVHQFFHNGFASPKALDMTAPPMLERIESHRQIELEAWAAQQSGLSPDSPQAWEIAERFLASVAELTAEATKQPLSEHDITELRRSMATPAPTSLARQHAEQAMSGFTGLLDTYLSLMATINGTPQPDPQGARASEQWIAAALTSSSGPHPDL